jgi:serine/threonine-protein kinase
VLTNLVAERLGQNARDALSNKVLDRYRIRRKVGRGGMGVVYEAQELEGARRVALKMMSHRLVYDKHARKRFEQEADLIESFAHSNIVGMYGRFLAFHTYFICLEFCGGGSLADAIEATGPLPADRIRQVFNQVESALKYAHERGIAHRDVKPANILFAGAGEAKLTDFGLSGPIDDAKATGRLYGTPRYMAPEQLAGQRAGKEVDFFALGCVAYEMIVGRPLFAASSIAALFRDHAKWEIPPIRGLRSDLDDDLCNRVQRCLSREPQLRVSESSAASRLEIG